MYNMIMADMTARILVDGRYMLRLWENDKAGWECVDLSYNSERKPRTTLGCNAPETVLKDGLLMIAMHCLEDKEIIKRANSMLKTKDMRIVETSTSSQFRGTNFFNLQALTDKQRAELYAMNRKRSDRCENCETRQHPATRKLMYLNITIFGQGMISKEWEQELKQHHASVSIGYAEFMKGTERIRD